MPFIIPAIVAAVGITGVAATIATAVLQVGASLAISYAASRIWAPKPPTASTETPSGAQVDLQLSTTVPRQIPVGWCATAGSLHYWQHRGDNNEYLELVIVLGDWPCDSYQGLIIDGDEVPLTLTSANHWDVGGKYAGYMSIRFHDGSWTQTADAELIANSGGDWTSAHKGAGVCYVVVDMKYSQDVYQSGIPQMVHVIKGAKLYDFTKDSTAGGSGAHRWADQTTWEWTDNPALIHYTIRRGLSRSGKHLYFMATPTASLPVSDFATAATICREDIALDAGGTEDRYTCDGMLVTSATNGSLLSDVMVSYHAKEAELGGTYRPLAGKAQSFVKTLTEEHFLIDADFAYMPIGGDTPVNAVYGTFVDPTAMYQLIDLPPRVSLTDEAADGERYEVSFNYNLVQSATQAQRLMEITRRLGRLRGVVQTTLSPEAVMMEVGDWVRVTLTQQGWTNKEFVIAELKQPRNDGIPVVLHEIEADAFLWTTADELSAGEGYIARDIVPPTAAITGLTVENVTILSDITGVQRPGIQIEWDTITDPTVTQIEVNYRVVGSGSVGLYKTIFDPSAGQYTWVDGIQGETVYEVRVAPVVVPARATAYTGFVQDVTPTTPQIVATALDVPDLSIGPEDLDAQTRFELSLVTAVDDVLGSVSQVNQQAIESARTNAAALIRDILDRFELETTVRTETITRITANDAFASQITVINAALTDPSTGLTASASAITALQTTVNHGVTGVVATATALSTLTATVGGISGSVSTLSSVTTTLSGQMTTVTAQYGIVVSAGAITASVSLSSGTAGSVFQVDANYFYVARPATTGGTGVAVFAIDTVSATPKLVLRGDMLADGTIFARMIAANQINATHIQASSIDATRLNVTTLSAITANMGTVNAGLINSTNGKMTIDLNNGTIVINT